MTASVMMFLAGLLIGALFTGSATRDVARLLREAELVIDCAPSFDWTPEAKRGAVRLLKQLRSRLGIKEETT